MIVDTCEHGAGAHERRIAMAGVKVSVLLIATAMLCTGCSLFYGNLFAGLDKPPAPKAADYEGTNGLDKLATDLGSPAVVALLSADPTTVAQIQAFLGGKYDLTSPATAADQTAAALSADLGLKTTQGDDLVNNVVTSIMNNPSSGNIADLIKSVIPPDVIADKTDDTAFVAMVEALLDAKVLYDNLGASIHTLGAPPGMNLGDVAQKAAVAFLMDAVVSTLEGAPYSYSKVQAETQMFDLVTDQANAISLVNVTDPFSPMPANLKYIFDAAGAPYPA
jgi:hypothetical protein